MILLQYGHTKTYFIPGHGGGVLLDTDWAGTLPALRRALKGAGLSLRDVRCLLVTHFHPDHAGLFGELQALGVPAAVTEEQLPFLHAADGVFAKEGNTAYVPPDEGAMRVLSCADSRAFLASLGVAGRLMHTPGHTDDSVSLLLDDGSAFVGDLPPLVNVPSFGGTPEGERMAASWETLRACGMKKAYYAHF